jgi:hypothetical protein
MHSNFVIELVGGKFDGEIHALQRRDYFPRTSFFSPAD